METYYVKKFNSLYQYNEYLRTGKVQSAFSSETSHSLNEPEWYGTQSYEEAENFLIRGNHELAEQLHDKMQGISAQNSGYFRNSITQAKLQRGVAGYRVNIGAYLSGSDKCMLRKVRQRVQYPVINILYNNGATGGYSAKTMTDTNARVLRAIQILEMEKGVRVNLYVAQCSKSNGAIAGPIVRIKDSDTIMDIEKIAYPLISPSMLRRQKFRFLEIYEGLPRHFADGYGSSLDNKEKLLGAAQSVNLKCDVYLTFYDAKDMSDEELMKCFNANNAVR